MSQSYVYCHVVNHVFKAILVRHNGASDIYAILQQLINNKKKSCEPRSSIDYHLSCSLADSQCSRLFSFHNFKVKWF